MKRTVHLIFGVLAIATLTACGGGGSEEAPAIAVVEIADKYIGTWVACSSSPSTSVRETFIFSKASATKVSYTFTQVGFDNTACSGLPPSSPFSATGTFTFAGTKVIDGKTVDKINDEFFAPVARTEKGVGFISGTTLTLGSDAPLDAEGYPTALDTAYIYNKQ